MKHFSLFLILITIVACKKEKKIELPESYTKELEAYRTKLHEGRKSGYLQLTGLHKLSSTNTFGKSTSNDFVFDVVDIPKKIGTITYNDSTVQFTAEENIIITNKNDSILNISNLTLDKYGSSVRMYHKHLNWQVITRSGNLYLRVWNEKNPAIENFKGFKFYDTNPELIVTGQFSYFDKAKNESVKSQLGVNANTNFIGNISFEYKGETYSLDVGENGFTMVGDVTSGDETYGGGRYIYLDLPKENGAVEIDFNKLYNPPCSFNKFTTCLYPPRQNQLPFKVTAGETITVNH